MLGPRDPSNLDDLRPGFQKRKTKKAIYQDPTVSGTSSPYENQLSRPKASQDHGGANAIDMFPKCYTLPCKCHLVNVPSILLSHNDSKGVASFGRSSASPGMVVAVAHATVSLQTKRETNALWPGAG